MAKGECGVTYENGTATRLRKQSLSMVKNKNNNAENS